MEMQPTRKWSIDKIEMIFLDTLKKNAEFGPKYFKLQTYWHQQFSTIIKIINKDS